MIKKLRFRFILLTTVSLIILMTLLVSGMNLLNYSSTVSDADEILSMLSKNNFPGKPFDEGPHIKELPHGMSPEVPYESRYFSVTVSDSSETEYDISRVVSVSRTEAQKYAEKALEKKNTRGSIDHFRYLRIEEDGKVRILFLDWGRKIDAFYRFLKISIIIALVGCLAVFLVILPVSERIIRPIAESYDKQKSFITDAGHEIKTPLTIIRANVDILESDTGENECLSDIRQQTERLSELTSGLVYLSKMEEAGKELPTVDFPVSDIIAEEAASFNALAATQHRNFTQNIQKGISVNGNAEETRRLVSILLENALKYSPEGGDVSIDFSKSKKSLMLTVSNTVSENIPKEELPRLFDRFYRTDRSRNSETGGHGIGLSVAHAIVSARGGKIRAECENKVFRINVIF